MSEKRDKILARLTEARAFLGDASDAVEELIGEMMEGTDEETVMDLFQAVDGALEAAEGVLKEAVSVEDYDWTEASLKEDEDDDEDGDGEDESDE